MKINFNKEFLNLDGDKAEGSISINKSLAQHLGGTKSTRIKVLDALEIAQKLNAGEVIDLTTNQQEDLKYFVENEMNLPPLFTGQILKLIAETKDAVLPKK